MRAAGAATLAAFTTLLAAARPLRPLALSTLAPALVFGALVALLWRRASSRAQRGLVVAGAVLTLAGAAFVESHASISYDTWSYELRYEDGTVEPPPGAALAHAVQVNVILLLSLAAGLLVTFALTALPRLPGLLVHLAGGLRRRRRAVTGVAGAALLAVLVVPPIALALRWRPRAALCAGRWECGGAAVSVYPDGLVYAVFDGGEGGASADRLGADRPWRCAGGLALDGAPCARAGAYDLGGWLYEVWLRDRASP
jgi:hypothetical protein